jgi:nucleotide-binding universal stress UspA family protein
MYKNILVPIALDHERDNNPTLYLAHKLLDKGGKITALHVLEHIDGYAEVYLSKDQLENRRKQAEADLVTEIADQKGVKPVVIAGHSGHSIVEYAKSQDVDCIIIASHRPGLQDYFLGSTAARVVRHANCSVHVVR